MSNVEERYEIWQRLLVRPHGVSYKELEKEISAKIDEGVDYEVLKQDKLRIKRLLKENAQSEDYGVDLADFWKQVIVRWVMGIDSIRLTNAKNDKAVVMVKKEMFDTVALSINSKRHSISRGDFFEAMVHTGMKECDANSLIEEVVSDEKKIMLFIESAKISQENKEERKIFTRSRIISLKYQL